MFYQTTSTIAEVISTVNRIKEATALFPEDNSIPDAESISSSAFEFNGASAVGLDGHRPYSTDMRW